MCTYFANLFKLYGLCNRIVELFLNVLLDQSYLEAIFALF